MVVLPSQIRNVAAGHQRENWQTGQLIAAEWLPQWSPPVTGGSTMALLWAHLLGEEPQWSPPMIGGNTP